MYSGLLLAPSDDYDGELDVHEIFTLDLNASLVVLSACQTGLGKLMTGDELVGLSRAFLGAGAQSLVSTLWAVYDESTGYFMECFYRNLQTHSKIEAIQMAQFSTKEKYMDIYYWAPFMLIGCAN
jgi:CHAT domain-containing protein